MKKIIIAGAVSLFAIAAASAQTTTGTTTPGTGTTGFGTKGAGTPGAGIPDTSSVGEQAAQPGSAGAAAMVTQEQAQARITGAGYASVTNLKQDASGVWHGMATKNGQQVSVWVDGKGHIGQS